MDGLIVVKSLSRGRPQGGRAMTMFSNVEFDSGDGSSSSSSSSIVNSSSFSEFDADFDRAARFLTPSRVEIIVKRSIFGFNTTTNR
eukprot:scaffold7134_cov174-Skeletonema_dohrnii-CCMP3373.AAC.1